MLNRIVKLEFLPSSIDAGLLFLRFSVCVSLFLKHGYMKVADFSYWAANFADPLGIGQTPSLIIAMISETVGCALIILGLATRWASLYCFSVIFVAWSLKGHFEYFGHGNPGDHGEATVLYLCVLVAIFIAGPGRYSIDARLND
jgi:putative oxidoreductase